VNRLQARLDEEEFGMVDPPPADSPTTTTTTAAATGKTQDDKKGKKVKEEGTLEKGTDSATAAGAESTDEPPASEETEKETKADKEIGLAVPVKPLPPGLSFEEKKRRRAQRFNIPVVQNDVLAEKEKGTNTKRQKSTEKEDSEKPLLPKDEIERRLERAKKYGGDPTATEELKAMLRQYRFKNNAIS